MGDRLPPAPPVNPDLLKALKAIDTIASVVLPKPRPEPNNLSDKIQRDRARQCGVDPDQKYVIRVYIDNGVCFEYDVTGAHKAREHATAIVNGGYRHNDGKGEFEHYPPHRILKVKVTGGVVPTLYPDRVSGT